MSQSYFYLNLEGEPEGPIDREGLRALFRDGQVGLDTQIATPGGEWKPLSQFPAFTRSRDSMVYAQQAPAHPQVVHIHHHHASTEKSGSAELAIVILLTLLFWPFGVVATVVYLLAGKFGNFLLLLVFTGIVWLLTQGIWIAILK